MEQTNYLAKTQRLNYLHQFPPAKAGGNSWINYATINRNEAFALINDRFN
jgi:hypothetical protein